MHSEIPGTSDVVVLGGGPAGSAFAGIVKKYAPGLRVTLLEKARFPRYHIGESTIPVANTVFRDLEVHERLAASGAIKKIGITFVWGADRTPWNADYLILRDRPGARPEQAPGQPPGQPIDIVGQDFAGLGRAPQAEPFTAFNVRRDQFDALLLDQARAFGAAVHEGVRATAVAPLDAAGSARAGSASRVSWQDESGRQGSIETDFVLDATGLSSLMTRDQRQRDPRMNNFAVYGYFANAGWKVTYNGSRSHTTVFICSIPCGWIWYFPIAEDVMSVGVVTHRDHFRDRLAGIDLERFYREMIADCPEVSDLLAGARLREDVLPGGGRVRASQDWSSWAEMPVGPGWAAAGDAAMFVDPILSSGVTLALQSGHRAAYTLLTARARPQATADAEPAQLWRAYADYIRGEAGAFLKLARFFYGNNRAAESWWWEAHRLINADGRLDIDPRRAFTMATAGFFPVPRALSLEIVGPLIAGAVGTTADLRHVHEHSGVPDADALDDLRIEPLARFRLALRTEPHAGAPPGQLRVFHDLVSDDPAFFHRLAVAPTEISPALAPLVDAVPRHATVRSLKAASPALVPAGTAPAATIERLAAQIVRVAAIKGFVKLC
jgi:flavin-dependent dehydrogenase